MRDDDKESRRFFRTGLWLDTPRRIELFGQETVSRHFFCFVDPSAFAQESCIKVAIHVRGGV